MVAEYITPYSSIEYVPDLYTRRIPKQHELDGIKINDLVLIGIRSKLEDAWYTEFFVIVVTHVKEGYIEGTVQNTMSLTVNHGVKQYSKVQLFEDHVFAILTEKEYVDLFE